MVKKKPSFEDELNRLQEIVAALEEGPATLEEMLKLFEEGIAVADRLERELAAAETKVQKLLRDATGGLDVADGDEDAA